MQPDFGEGQPHVEKFRLRWELLDEEALVPPSGAVLYHQKRQPIHQTEEVEEDARPFIFTRGSADVSGISAKLDAGGEDIWSEATARAENVHLLRPSHDSWGIRKIIFCFADDFLQRCYRFPLWRDPEWRALLDPIFAAAGIAPSQVVRCLIASMPPRTVIPVHHDTGLRQSLVVSRISRVKQGPHVETSTGYWVKHTHRVHCAIRTDAKVVFRVGPDEENLLRFQLAPGEVVELNNQAKHFVTNFWDEYRSHLIFDFVDEAAPADLRFPRMPEIDVAVGDELVQTRRSIDLRRDEGTGISPPHFLIIGAQKVQGAPRAALEHPSKPRPQLGAVCYDGRRRLTRFRALGGNDEHVRVHLPASLRHKGEEARDALLGLAMANETPGPQRIGGVYREGYQSSTPPFFLVGP